jgi:hypothetical protein
MYNQGLRICNTQTTQLHMENPVNYINLPRAQREIVLRTWRTTLLYPLPKEVVTELRDAGRSNLPLSITFSGDGYRTT